MFNWTTFLAGLAIGLWIAVVALFLIPQQLDREYVVVSGSPDTAYGGGVKTLWVPSGGGLYRCTNNDHGGGVVEDHGRGNVDDHGGGNVEDHGGGNVEDHGGGNVEDGAAHVPAPKENRGYQEFWCDLNRYGGPIVRARDGRIVSVAMPVQGEFICAKDVSGNAVVTDSDNKLYAIDHGGGNVEDHGGGNVEDHGPNTGGYNWSDRSDQPGGSDRVYCQVLHRDSPPKIVDVDGNEVTLP
jgi:hypothetical protein